MLSEGLLDLLSLDLSKSVKWISIAFSDDSELVLTLLHRAHYDNPDDEDEDMEGGDVENEAIPFGTPAQ